MPESRFREIALAARVRHSGKRSTQRAVLMELTMNLVQRDDALADGPPLATYYQAQLALDLRGAVHKAASPSAVARTTSGKPVTPAKVPTLALASRDTF